MSVEQVAREVVMNMMNPAKVSGLLAPNAMASGGIFPPGQEMPMSDATKRMGSFTTAFPDVKFEIQQVTVRGNEATVKAKWSGTNTGPFAIPLPGMPNVPATGKKVSVDDVYVVTVEGDKVTHMRVDSPAGGGVPGALKQLGINMPAM
jgi:predicted ester cyclase